MTTTLTVDAATLVENVKGYTLNESGKLITFKNLVIDEGKVVALDIDKGNTSVDSTIDGKGKVMLPGLIDAHGHLLCSANLLKSICAVTRRGLTVAGTHLRMDNKLDYRRLEPGIVV